MQLPIKFATSNAIVHNYSKFLSYSVTLEVLKKPFNMINLIIQTVWMNISSQHTTDKERN